jgi:hypothetical protein
VTDSSPATGVPRTIKFVHTVMWAGFAGCILAIPVLAVRWMGAGAWAASAREAAQAHPLSLLQA